MDTQVGLTLTGSQQAVALRLANMRPHICNAHFSVFRLRATGIVANMDLAESYGRDAVQFWAEAEAAWARKDVATAQRKVERAYERLSRLDMIIKDIE